MQPPGLLDELRQLESALHRADVRADRSRLSSLLHEGFWEIGRSGEVWSRAATLSEFESTSQNYSVWAQDFYVEQLSCRISLLAYRSAHVSPAGVFERHTCRASIWIRADDGWKLRFHQGTATDPFEPRGGTRLGASLAHQ